MNLKSTSLIKQFTWDGMQKRRAQGLCFSCYAKFVPGHKCKGPQLLLLEENQYESELSDEEEGQSNLQDETEISLHDLTGW